MELAARIGTMAANGNGFLPKEVGHLHNVFATNITNCADLSNYIGLLISENATDIETILYGGFFRITPGDGNYQRQNLIVGSAFFNRIPGADQFSMVRYRSGLFSQCGTSSIYDANIIAGDILDIYYMTTAVRGGGYNRRCVRRSYRRSSRPSARFYAALPRWEVAA